MSACPEPHKLEELLEEYSHKLEDLKSKFNPFFSQVSHELKDRVDALKGRIELYANYHRDHQLKHLLEEKKVQDELSSVHQEVEKVQSEFNRLEKMIRFGQNLQ